MSHALWLRLRALFHRRKLERDLQDELAFHLALKAERLGDGMAARRAFGNVTRVNEDCRALWSFERLEGWWRDVRDGVRMLWRSPGYAAAIVVTLALGIGANLAVFSVFNALLLRPVDVRQPEQLVQLSGIYRNGGRVPLSYPMYRALDKLQGVCTAWIGWSVGQTMNVDSGGTAAEAMVRAVSGNYYSDLGVAPSRGRLIAPGDVDVAVLGYEYWQRRFSGDEGVVGRMLRIDGRAVTVIGVTRPWFTALMPGVAPDVTIPLEAMPARTLESRASLWIRVTGRLRDGVNPEQAKAALAAPWAELLRATVPTGSPGPRRDAYFAMGLELLPAAQGAARGLGTAWRRPLELLLSACGLMLVLAALNLATLALARAVARGHELGVRAALGAGHWALGRRVLVENAVLAVCGAVLALGVTEWGGRVLAGLLSASEPALVDARPDWRVAGYALGAALLAAVLMSLAPLWRVACIDLPGGLREGGRGGQRGLGRPGQALVVMQMALTVVLVAGAGLLARTLYGLSTLDLGFERRGLLELGLAPQGRGYEGIDINTYTRELLERVGRTNGVRAAALTDGPVPMGRDGGWRETVVLDGRESLATLRVVTPGFFRTLGVALESGRDFGWDDDARRPAWAIVDARLAARLAPGGGLIGRRVRFGVQPEFQALEVVGVARPARLVDLRDDGAALIYVPAAQHADWATPGVLMVRGGRAGDVETTVRGLGREFVARVRSLEQASAATLVEERTIALLAALFAALSVGLAATGLFGLISYSTTRRRRELGIRLALGCERGRMMTLILSDTLRLAVAGLALGVPAALIAGRLMGHLLHGVAWYDPPTLAATALLLVGVGLMAGYLPARRAARLDPSRALRAE